MAAGRNALGLSLIAALAFLFVELTYYGLRPHFPPPSPQPYEKELALVFSGVEFDNDPLRNPISIGAPEIPGGQQPRAWIARMQGQMTAAAILLSARGYNGVIDLLVVLEAEARLLEVRILHHRETPAFGGLALAADSPWLARLAGLSLDPAGHWTRRGVAVQPDAMSSATVTSRGVLAAVRRALILHGLGALDGKPQDQPPADTGSAVESAPPA